MKNVAFIVLICAVGCTDGDIAELRENTFILQSVINAGEAYQEVTLRTFDGTTGEEVPANGIARLHTSAGTLLLSGSAGHFQTPENAPPVPFDEMGTVTCEAGGRILSGRFHAPPELSVTGSGPTVFPIDTDVPQQSAFVISWSDIPANEYVVTLRCLEESPVLIPFAGQGGQFNQRFAGPQIDNGMILRNNDFLYYGQHELKVTAINPEYRDVFFYSPGGTGSLLQQGISNISGGSGFVTAVSSFVLLLTATP